MVFPGARALICLLVVPGSPVVTYQSFLSHAPMTLRALPPTIIGGGVAPRRPPQRHLSLRVLRPPPPRPPGDPQQARVMAAPRREGRSPCHSCPPVPAVLRMPRLRPCLT